MIMEFNPFISIVKNAALSFKACSVQAKVVFRKMDGLFVLQTPLGIRPLIGEDCKDCCSW